jgi:hypothetical protein
VTEFLKTVSAPTRLAFVIDATGSRQEGWDLASSLQAQMFEEAAKLGSLSIQLIYYRGRDEVKQSPWMTDGRALARMMSKVSCHSGMTQIRRALDCVRQESAREKIAAVVFVGDAMEEDHATLCKTAAELGAPLYIFQEGDDPEAAETFVEMARLTGGAHCFFDANSARQLADLLRAVAAIATGGIKALENLKTDSARLLLGKLK